MRKVTYMLYRGDSMVAKTTDYAEAGKFLEMFPTSHIEVNLAEMREEDTPEMEKLREKWERFKTYYKYRA